MIANSKVGGLTWMIGPCGSRWSVTGVLRMRTDACSKCNVRIYKVPQYAKDLLALKPGTLNDTS